MKCAWNALISVLPQWLRPWVSQHERDHPQEIRLRCGKSPEMICETGVSQSGQAVSTNDLNFVINAASKYSPWAAASVAQGYLTAPGGHRIGICGEAVIKSGHLSGFRTPESLCIRIARDIPGVSASIPLPEGSFLILGAPGWGKTTLLRDLLRRIASQRIVSVVDERAELFPDGFERGKRMDILSGCPKKEGIEILLRTMGPEFIGLDEITAAEDCEALIRAFGSGVHLAATAHASSLDDFCKRSIYRPLVEKHVFETILLLDKDKSCRMEAIA